MMQSTRTQEHVVEITRTVAAAPETVYEHIAREEGVAFLAGTLASKGDGRRLILIAPDARGETR